MRMMDTSSRKQDPQMSQRNKDVWEKMQH